MHAQGVVHLTHARHVFGDVLSMPLVMAIADEAGQRHLAVPYRDLDVAGIEVRIIGESIADVFADPLIRPLVALRSAAAELAARFAPARRRPDGTIIARGTPDVLIVPRRIVSRRVAPAKASAAEVALSIEAAVNGASIRTAIDVAAIRAATARVRSALATVVRASAVRASTVPRPRLEACRT